MATSENTFTSTDPIPTSSQSSHSSFTNLLNQPSLHVKIFCPFFPDQIFTLDASPQWTFRHIKSCLESKIPGNPNVLDQRLIYFGKLLNDSDLIRKVLRLVILLLYHFIDFS